MSMLKLSAHELPAAEVVLAQTLFRLFAHRGDFRWCLASDAVTNTPPPPPRLLPDGISQSRAVPRITRFDTPEAAGTLRRPVLDRRQPHMPLPTPPSGKRT
ncbi:MAG: hypothetical protein QM772_16925 [Ottowia sp.]|uniref:hypothetical protein n=1 Tax=Ottowia sp. TaxID=1898956 RepID=UPI0039E29BAA